MRKQSCSKFIIDYYPVTFYYEKICFEESFQNHFLIIFKDKILFENSIMKNIFLFNLILYIITRNTKNLNYYIF